MAINLDLSASQYGVPFAGAYFRIVTAASMRQGNGKHRVLIDVHGYAIKPETLDTREVDMRRYHALMDEVEAQTGDTFLAKCYAWVMAQADMAGSTAA